VPLKKTSEKGWFTGTSVNVTSPVLDHDPMVFS